MNVSTFNMVMNSSEIDFDEDFCPTLADAIGYAEFEESINSWEDVVED